MTTPTRLFGEREPDEGEPARERADEDPRRATAELRARAVGDLPGDRLREHREEGADRHHDREVRDLVGLAEQRGDLRGQEDARDRTPDEEDAEVRGDDPAEQSADALDRGGRILVARCLFEEGERLLGFVGPRVGCGLGGRRRCHEWSFQGLVGEAIGKPYNARFSLASD